MRKNDCVIEDESILDCDIYRTVVSSEWATYCRENQEFVRLFINKLLCFIIKTVVNKYLYKL